MTVYLQCLTGRKAGKGFFNYKGKRSVSTFILHNMVYDDLTKILLMMFICSLKVNDEALQVLKQFAVPKKGSHKSEEIQMRLAGRFINEAALCLQEGVLQNPVRIYAYFQKPCHGSKQQASR